MKTEKTKKTYGFFDRGDCKFVPNEQLKHMSPVRYSQKEQLFLTWTDSHK